MTRADRTQFRSGRSAGEEEEEEEVLKYSQAAERKKNLTIQFFCLDVFSLLHVFLICSNILRPCDCVKVS